MSGQFLEKVNGDKRVPVAGARLIFGSADSAESYSVDNDKDGFFSAEPGRGVWKTFADTNTGEPEFLREIYIDHSPVRLSAFINGEEKLPELENPVTVDFDQITALPITKMPVYPAALRWTDLIVTRNTTYVGAGYMNNTVAGAYVGYNSTGYPVVVESDRPFDFVGAYFGVAWTDAEGETLNVRAWRDYQLVREETLSLSAMGPVWFDADFRSVTRVEFATKHYWQFVMDKPVFRLADDLGEAQAFEAGEKL